MSPALHSVPLGTAGIELQRLTTPTRLGNTSMVRGGEQRARHQGWQPINKRGSSPFGNHPKADMYEPQLPPSHRCLMEEASGPGPQRWQLVLSLAGGRRGQRARSPPVGCGVGPLWGEWG